MEIRPLRSDADYRSALSEINTLESALPGTNDFDRLEIWITLVSDYEARLNPIAPPDPIDAIFFAMDRLNISRRDLEAHLGGSGRVSEILNRERRLTLPMMRRLNAALNIPLAILAQEYPRRSKTGANSRRLTKKASTVSRSSSLPSGAS